MAETWQCNGPNYWSLHTCLILTAKVREEKNWFPLGYSY